MAIEKSEWRAIWITTIIVTLSSVIIGGLLRLVEKNFLNKEMYKFAANFFNNAQPDYFPLLFLFAGFFITLATVLFYRALLPHLPSSWIVRGLLIGGFLYLVGDLPNHLYFGYTTVIPAEIARGTAAVALVNRLINGCILVYAYRRFSPGWGSPTAKQGV